MYIELWKNLVFLFSGKMCSEKAPFHLECIYKIALLRYSSDCQFLNAHWSSIYFKCVFENIYSFCLATLDVVSGSKHYSSAIVFPDDIYFRVLYTVKYSFKCIDDVILLSILYYSSGEKQCFKICQYTDKTEVLCVLSLKDYPRLPWLLYGKFSLMIKSSPFTSQWCPFFLYLVKTEFY